MDTVDYLPQSKAIYSAISSIQPFLSFFGSDSQGNAHTVAQQLKDKLAIFSEHLPLITALRNPGLRDRHWKKLSNELGFDLRPDDSFSLARAVQLNLQDNMKVGMRFEKKRGVARKGINSLC